MTPRAFYKLSTFWIALALTSCSTVKPIPETSAQSTKERAEPGVHVRHFQDAKGPLLVYFINNDNHEISGLSLSSQLINHDQVILKEVEWEIEEMLLPNSKSRYYPVPVTYHLDRQHTVKTRITEIITEQGHPHD